MPTYIYECPSSLVDDIERNVPIAERDEQICEHCGLPLIRKIVFTGLTWSPTRNGGFS